jgi:hypothetical protein
MSADLFILTGGVWIVLNIVRIGLVAALADRIAGDGLRSGHGPLRSSVHHPSHAANEARPYSAGCCKADA